MSDVTHHAGYEKKDVNLLQMIVVTLIIIAIIIGFLVGLDNWFTFTAEKRIKDVVLQPEAADYRDLRAHEDDVLTTYAVLDDSAGVYRIPIDRAMKLMAERAFESQMEGR
ncbi:MAG: hypothetical protein D6675_01395 [Gemmatimonadetes bacterium]|nr:MAG: hypothetical protein D6675_01395 [Gemmatimonadota bacterium]